MTAERCRCSHLCILQPDYRLLVDRPFADQAKAYWLITSIWLVLEGATMAGMILKVGWDGGLSLPFCCPKCHMTASLPVDTLPNDCMLCALRCAAQLNKIRRTTIRTITCDTDLMMMSCPATPTQIAATGGRAWLATDV